MNPATRALLIRSRDNALNTAANDADNGNLDEARFNRGMAAAMSLFIDYDGDLDAVGDMFTSFDPPSSPFAAGYRKASDDLARLA